MSWKSASGSHAVDMRIAFIAVLTFAGVLLTEARATDACSSGDGQAAQLLRRALALSVMGQKADPFLNAVGVQCTPKLLTVTLPPGKLRVTQSVALGSLGKALGDRSLKILGSGRNRTILSGAMVVAAWAKLQDGASIARLAVPARDHVVVAPLPKEVADYVGLQRRGFGTRGIVAHPELYWRGARLPLARWPDDGFAHVDRTDVDSPGWFAFADASSPKFVSGTHLWAGGYWYHDWAYFHLPVTANNDSVSGFSIDGELPRYGVRTGARVYLYNALELLDRPGEWVLDLSRRLIYLWPPTDASSSVEISVAKTVLDLDGARGVSVGDLTVEGARGDVVSMRDVDDVRLSNCVVRNAGSRGVVVKGRNSAVERCSIQATGDAGLQLEGGDRATLEPSRLTAQSNVIGDTGAWTRTYAPAIDARGVGVHVTHNNLYSLPHSAVLLVGNDHVVEHNRIADVATETGDVGAVYIQRDWTARGNRIADNIFVNIQGVGRYGATAVYFDDFVSGAEVVHNVFMNVHRGVLIGGGRDNQVMSNLFVNTAIPIHIDSRGENWRKELVQNRDSELWNALRAVPFDREPFRSRYPELARLPDDQPELPKRNVIIGNVAVRSTLASSSVERPDLQRWQDNTDLQQVDERGLNETLQARPAPNAVIQRQDADAASCAAPAVVSWVCDVLSAAPPPP